MSKLVSKCCQAGMEVVVGDEGTNHYECVKCWRPCDVLNIADDMKPMQKSPNLCKPNKKTGGEVIQKEWRCGCGDIHNMAQGYCLGCLDERPFKPPITKPTKKAELLNHIAIVQESREAYERGDVQTWEDFKNTKLNMTNKPPITKLEKGEKEIKGKCPGCPKCDARKRVQKEYDSKYNKLPLRIERNRHRFHHPGGKPYRHCSLCQQEPLVSSVTNKPKWEEKLFTLIEERFDDECLDGYVCDFVTDLLKLQKQQWVKKIEKLKLNLPKTKGMGLANDIIEKHEWSYNQAIDQIIQIIKKHE